VRYRGKEKEMKTISTKIFLLITSQCISAKNSNLKGRVTAATYIYLMMAILIVMWKFTESPSSYVVDM